MKNKIYELVGRAVVLLASWGLSVYTTINLIIFLLDNCCPTLW